MFFFYKYVWPTFTWYHEFAIVTSAALLSPQSIQFVCLCFIVSFTSPSHIVTDFISAKLHFISVTLPVLKDCALQKCLIVSCKNVSTKKTFLDNHSVL